VASSKVEIVNLTKSLDQSKKQLVVEVSKSENLARQAQQSENDLNAARTESAADKRKTQE
jgi:hypothetical protein